MEILYVVIGLFILDVTSILWGADSRDSVYSSEYSKRGSWRGFCDVTK